MNINISFRNPVEFVGQWAYQPLREKLVACLFWMLYIWYDSFGVYKELGIRILGIEIVFYNDNMFQDIYSY